MAGTPIFHKDLYVTQTAVASYDRTTDATGKLAFTLPKGALVLRAVAIVSTAFNGTSPTVTVGTATDADAYGASAAIAPATAGVKALTLSGEGVAPVTADSDVFFTVSEPGDGTAGKVWIIVEFAAVHGITDVS